MFAFHDVPSRRFAPRFVFFLDSRMHSVELRSHFCLGRLCERRRYSRTPKLATSLVTSSQRKVVTTPEENACFSYTFFCTYKLVQITVLEGSMI